MYDAGMTRRWRVAVASALGVVLGGFGVAPTPAVGVGPNVLLVSPTPPAGGYISIQAAVDAANPGDWILIAPGVYHEKGFNPVSGPEKPPPAEVYITKPNLHIRGMNRTGVIVDGTNVSTTQGAGTLPAGSPACSGDPALQDPGLPESDGNTHTREGILVWQTVGVSIEEDRYARQLRVFVGCAQSVPAATLNHPVTAIDVEPLLSIPLSRTTRIVERLRAPVGRLFGGRDLDLPLCAIHALRKNGGVGNRKNAGEPQGAGSSHERTLPAHTGLDKRTIWSPSSWMGRPSRPTRW